MRKSVILALVVLVMASIAVNAEEVRIGGFGGNDTVIMEELLGRFVRPALEEQGITVVYEPVADDYQRYIVNALSAGTAPDLFYVDIFWAQSLMESNVLEPLDQYLATSDLLSAEDIVENLLEGFTYGDSLYGIPKDFNTLALFYNKDLFDYAGVAYPDKMDTWETLEEKLLAVAAIDPDIHGLALAPEYARMGALAHAAGFTPIDDAGNTDLLAPEFTDAFNWYTSLADKGAGIMPADLGQGWGGGAFATEQVAATMEGAWLIGALQDEAPNLDYGTTLLPLHPETNQRGNLIFTVAWSINANSDKKQAAFQVLEQLTSPEVQQWVLERGLAIPSRAELADNPYFELGTREAQANSTVFAGASDGNVLPFSFQQYGGDWMDPINQALTAVMSGELGAEQALDEAQSRLDRLMD